MATSFTPPALPQLNDSETHSKAQDSVFWGQLQGSSLALSIATAAQSQSAPFVVVTPDTPSANRLERELSFFVEKQSVSVSLLPDWETLPYDTFSPHQEIISQRLEALNHLRALPQGIVIVPISTLMLRTAPRDYFDRYLFLLKKGQRIQLESFKQNLTRSGYQQVSQVMQHGECSIRGSIIDLFPMGSQHPYRIDLFDDEIDSIRLFDPDSQRSAEKVNEIKLLPAHEFPTDQAGIDCFKQQFQVNFEASNSKDSLYYQVSKGGLPGGIEYYFPLFFETTETLFNYFPPNTTVMLLEGVHDAATRFFDDVTERYEQRRYDTLRPILAPSELYLRTELLFAELKHWPRIQLSNQQLEDKAGRYNFAVERINDLKVQPQSKSPLVGVTSQLEKWQKQQVKVLFCAESQGRRESLIALLGKGKVKPKTFTSLESFIQASDPVGIAVGLVENSFIIQEANFTIAFITESELLGHKVSQRRLREKRQATDENAVIKHLAELNIGQPVVHLDHGVGRYIGLQTLDAGGLKTEYLTIEYAKEAKLYVPVSALHLISRYTGGDIDHAPLHALGSDAWSKARKKAAEKVRDVAAQLLDIYAKRAAKPGYSYPINWQEYNGFADSFPFEETADQEQAINAIINDMGNATAMDRLVCGDVGFGKTEVAMRAAFICANHGKQVAILVPTTLLAQQHFENFKDRFADWPFRIEVVSRFLTAKEQQAVLQDLADGKVDIVVGTHKLLQKDIKYKDLGLVIIDEEHRFGVRQKETFKSLRAEIDVLTLTATPIPRTLNMALSGMRDLSIIATPPAKRLAIKTFVHQRDDALIREAVMREIMRGGQVYFLHNEVDTIEKTAQELADIIPEARIAIGHGQMREKELEQVMSDFYHQRFNLLVCTTIVETGIDVPSANTIIMDRADHLGLAQLHQLRGRVGRSHHQAYAYLLTPHPKRMTKDAHKRLEAISSLENLGAGFALATHDLEIRGAGELLGDEQSGQIATVGFTLYMDMLEQAVKSLKEGKEVALDEVLAQQTEIELRIPALLPDDYIPDVNIRLSFYKQIASCNDEKALEETQIALIDRFGLLPIAAKNLFSVTKMKQIASKLGITKIECHASGGYVEFAQDTTIDPGFIISLIQKYPSKYRFDGPQKLKLLIKQPEDKKRIELVEGLLNNFSQQQKK